MISLMLQCSKSTGLGPLLGTTRTNASIKYVFSQGSTAMLPEPSCWLVCSQELSAPSVLQSKCTDY